MRERAIVVTLSVYLSVSLSVCHFLVLEKASFSGLNLHQYILGDNLSPLNVANRNYFGEKASGTSSHVADDSIRKVFEKWKLTTYRIFFTSSTVAFRVYIWTAELQKARTPKAFLLQLQ